MHVSLRDDDLMIEFVDHEPKGPLMRVYVVDSSNPENPRASVESETPFVWGEYFLFDELNLVVGKIVKGVRATRV